MRKTMLPLLIMIYILLIALPAPAMEYEPDGFRDIRWGTPVPKNNFFGFNKLGMEFNRQESSSYESTLVYNRKKEDLMLGGATLTEIWYVFMEELGFCGVRIYFQGDENFELIRKACIDSWGEPTEEVFYKATNNTDIFWRGEKVLISIFYSHNFPTLERQGSLLISLRAYFDASDEAAARYKQRKKGF